MVIDVLLVALLVGAFLLGIFRGALRQLVALGAWLVTFLLSAHVRPQIADWLEGQFATLSRPYVEMVVFVIAFVLLFGLALAIIQIGGRDITLISRPVVDDLLGGAVMLVVAILAVSSFVIALDSFYATQPIGEVGLSALDELNSSFQRSAIIGTLRDSLVPGLHALLDPLLPADVRAAG